MFASRYRVVSGFRGWKFQKADILIYFQRHVRARTPEPCRGSPPVARIHRAVSILPRGEHALLLRPRRLLGWNEAAAILTAAGRGEISPRGNPSAHWWVGWWAK